MKSVLTYTVLRLLILLSFLAVGYLVGLRGIVLLLVSVLTSGIVSLFVLSRNRDQVSTSISGLFQGINNRISRAAQKEDKIIDGD
jgi:uncharacterized membrane protein required for colicin V production